MNPYNIKATLDNRILTLDHSLSKEKGRAIIFLWAIRPRFKCIFTYLFEINEELETPEFK